MENKQLYAVSKDAGKTWEIRWYYEDEAEEIRSKDIIITAEEYRRYLRQRVKDLKSEIEKADEKLRLLKVMLEWDKTHPPVDYGNHKAARKRALCQPGEWLGGEFGLDACDFGAQAWGDS